MALSLNANFVAAARKGTCEPRFLVQLYVDAATSYKFLSGKCTSVAYPESLSSITPVTRSLDWKTRKPSTDTGSLVFVRDALWDSLINSHGIKGAYVDIKLGLADLAEGDFEQHAVLIVDSVSESESQITLKCKGVETKLGDVKVYWQWFGLHPLVAAKHILTLCGVPASRIDTSAFDPATYDTSISHFVVSRVHSGTMHDGASGMDATNALAKPERADELLVGISQILGGAIHDDDAGQFTFTRFDPTKAVTDSWTENDISDLIIEPLYENLTNRVAVNTHPFMFASGDSYKHEYIDEDATSQSSFATVVPGGADADNVQEMVIDTDWISGVSELRSAVTVAWPTDTESFEIQGFIPYGFCGTAWGDIIDGPPVDAYKYYSYPSYGLGGAQNAEHIVSAARPVYVKIDSEIIKCDALTVSDWGFMFPAPIYSDAVIPYVLSLRVAASGRGALGTDPAIHLGILSYVDNPALVYDVTIQQWISKQIVTRLKDGGQVIRCTTGLDKYETQRGDFVDLTLPASRYRAKGKAGLSNTTKFEVTEKALDLQSRPPGIKWTLVEASWSGAGAHTEAVYGHYIGGMSTDVIQAAANSDVGLPHVNSGLGVGTAGFVATFAVGVASNVLTSARPREPFSFTVSALKDTYFAIDTVSRGVVAYEVANLAAQPDKAPQEAWLWKVVSDGAGITGTTDLRTLTAIDGDRLHDSTVDTLQLNALAVTNAKIGLLAVDTPQIAALAVEEAKIGALAVTSGKIGTSAVIAGKIATGGVSAATQIATGTVGVEQSLGADVRNTVNRNSHFLQYTRG